MIFKTKIFFAEIKLETLKVLRSFLFYQEVIKLHAPHPTRRAEPPKAYQLGSAIRYTIIKLQYNFSMSNPSSAALSEKIMRSAVWIFFN